MGVLCHSEVRSPRRRAVGAWLTLSAALLALIAQLSGVAHMVLERHVRCAEHGEWIHGDSHAAGDRHAAVESGQQEVPRQTELRSTADDVEHGHEHCAVCTHRKRQALPEAVALPFEPAWVAKAAASPRALAILTSTALWSLAPKTSPPGV